MNRKLICNIPHLTDSYDIEVGSGLLKDFHHVKQSLVGLGSRFALITDNNVGSLYGMSLSRALMAEGLDVSLFSIPGGEEAKSRKTKEWLEDQLFENSFGRDTCILAMGGGVVTDLAGYLAATYCRGVPFVMLPTSLLGMVDASIGGKTGVNTPYGKNLLGCICQPKKVIIDPSLLSSLPLSELRNGVVEIIKHGLIADKSLFHFLEQHSVQLLNLESAILDQVIFESCRIKKEIVEQDEKEQGKRRLLNFGHTIGHALESLSHYIMAHGEAVAIGLLVESRIAFQMGHLQLSSFNRIRAILDAYNLPLQLPSNLSHSSMLEAMRLDKKSLKGRPRFVIINDIGSSLEYDGIYCTYVDENIIKESLDWMIHDLCCH